MNKPIASATSTPKGWKPVRRGQIYCAPACGRNCTWSEYQRAIRIATRMAKDLGPRWKPTLTHNLGWFPKAECPYAIVHHMDAHRYWASIEVGPIQFYGYGLTSISAFDEAYRKLRETEMEISKVMSATRRIPR